MSDNTTKEGVDVTGIEYRSWTPDLEVRSEGDGRTVFGIAVPYNKPQRIDDTLTEVFLPGAFRAQMKAANRVVFARDHLRHGGTLIGRLTEMRDDAKGLYIEARISATSVGEDTLTLLRDKVLEEMSIGFAERQNRRRPDGVMERVTAHLAEVAVVLEGAYGRGARATGVRSAVDDGTCPTCGHVEGSDPRLGSLRAREVLAKLPVLLP
jgi:HK97 family phage prohead protease